MKVRPSVKPMCEKCRVIKRHGKVLVICENNAVSVDAVVDQLGDDSLALLEADGGELVPLPARGHEPEAVHTAYSVSRGDTQGRRRWLRHITTHTRQESSPVW